MDRKQPLWLPKGSVRSILSLIIVGGAMVASFVDSGAADRLMPLAGVVFIYYFETRGKAS